MAVYPTPWKMSSKKLPVPLMRIICDEVILENGRENSFCKLLQEVTSFSISKAAEDTLRLDMNIAGVWQTA